MALFSLKKKESNCTLG